jgi:hypothetical protein
VATAKAEVGRGIVFAEAEHLLRLRETFEIDWTKGKELEP